MGQQTSSKVSIAKAVGVPVAGNAGKAFVIIIVVVRSPQ